MGKRKQVVFMEDGGAREGEKMAERSDEQKVVGDYRNTVEGTHKGRGPEEARKEANQDKHGVQNNHESPVGTPWELKGHALKTLVNLASSPVTPGYGVLDPGELYLFSQGG